MMHDSMTKKLDMLIDRQAEIQNLLIQPETSNDINLLTELNKEFADINPIAELYSEYKDLMQVIEEAKQIIEMGDEDLMALAE
jgi:peptide chain release factor 1